MFRRKLILCSLFHQGFYYIRMQIQRQAHVFTSLLHQQFFPQMFLVTICESGYGLLVSDNKIRNRVRNIHFVDQLKLPL
jgi:hypothetical protein